MASRDETVHVTADANVTSIQITINLGKSAESALPTPSNAPKGVFVRHGFSEPGADPVKKVRLSFIPDDAAQNASSDIFNANQAEPTKWLELLGDPDPAGFDLDAGVIVLRMNEDGGIIAWLPENTNQEPIFLPVKQKVENVPGGVSIGNFIACFIEHGSTAAAATQCISML